MENKTHKLLPKLLSLQNRIMMWRQVGKACSETEWDESELILDDLSKVIKECTDSPNLNIPNYTLQLYNDYYKLYNCIPGEKLAYTSRDGIKARKWGY